MIPLKRKLFKIGARYGHVGQGKGLEVYIPILAADLMHAIKRAQMMGGLKKGFKDFWFAQEIGPYEFTKTREEWKKFKAQMRARLEEKKMRRRTG